MARTTKRRLDLHESLSRPTFDNAIICTYTFDPLFFENYCLDKFGSLTNNNNISVLTDRSTYLKVLYAPESQRPKRVNLRYLLHKIEVTSRFHSKLFLFTTKTTGRLIVGSANFTHAGLTTNAEVVDVFDFKLGESEDDLPLFQDALAFVVGLAARWPSESLTSNLDELQRNTPWLSAATERPERSIRLIQNIEHSLWGQISTHVTGSVEIVHIVSRFFDERPDLIDRVIKQWNPAKVRIYTQNGVTTMTPEWLNHPCVQSGRVELLLCQYEDDGHQQPLHAKTLIFESGSDRTLIYGSANFTSAALLSSGGRGNLETLIALPSLSERDLNAARFCDPAGTAYHLRSADQLKTAPREEEGPNDDSAPIRLLEAILDADRLMIRADIPSDIQLSAVVARITFEGTRGQLLAVNRISDGRIVAKVQERIIPRLQEVASIVGLEAISGPKPLSNLIFVTNLLDVKTQNNVRRERHIREAAESAGQFFAVLNALLLAGDDAALLTFLNFCDIPLLNLARGPALRQRPVWEGTNGMRALGEGNLRICKTLHEATLQFFERHLKKLKRHTDSLYIEGISNFLHIFLSMGSLLRMQIERAVIALEAKSTVVSPQEWYDCRELWDAYLVRFRELMTCLWDGYLQPLSIEHGRKNFQQEVGPDLDAVHELCDEMILIRLRIEHVRLTKCVQNQIYKKNRPYPYFHSILEEEAWQKYASDIQTRQRGVEMAVLGHAGHTLPSIGSPPRNQLFE